MGVLRQRGQRKKVLLACSCPRAAEPLSTFYLLMSRGKVNLDRSSPIRHRRTTTSRLRTRFILEVVMYEPYQGLLQAFDLAQEALLMSLQKSSGVSRSFSVTFT